MMRRRIAALGAIGNRIARFLSIGRWLVSIAREMAPRQVAFVPVLSVAALTLQIGAIVLATQFIARFQANDPAGTAAGLLSTRLGQPLVQAIVIGLLLALAGIFHYLASRLSLSAYQDVSVGITRKILTGLQALPGPFEKWRLMRRIGRRGMLKTLSVDVDKCGLATRILLTNTINVFFLLAGLAFFLWVAPVLFGGLLVIALIGVVLAYPMSLKAVRSASALEESQRRRRNMLTLGLDTSLSGEPPRETDSRMRELQETERGFVRLLTDRFAVIDGSRFAMSLLFALVVGLLLVSVALDTKHLLFDYSRLLILFFAFRFTYQGLQGLLIGAATINRFLPDMGRLADLLAQIERARAAPPRAAPDVASALPGKRADFVWGREAGGGSLEPGRLHLVVERPDVRPEVLFRLLDFVTRDHARLARQLVDGRVAPANSAAADAGSGTTAPAWIDATVALLRQAGGGSGGAAPGEEEVRALLAAIDATARRGAPMLVIADPLIVRLPRAAMSRLLEEFPDRLVIASIPWAAEIGPGLDFGWMLVGNGREIAFAGAARTMTEVDWGQARRIYDMAAGAGGARPDDEDDLDMDA